ncbi:hypothetical protein [Streptomyces inhibens]|uniref:hypothetical protein n=1 Tax=Streptomyces inhibens TaxID=2293571 RepID=UPI001EE71E39|nr:hypothetical protein [Streptomyces inhibens]UKY48523.1 hypothetical protein KI385_06735 [Streptomyces inhibens]
MVDEVDLDENVLRRTFALPGRGRSGGVTLRGTLPTDTTIALRLDHREPPCPPAISNSGVPVADPVGHRR